MEINRKVRSVMVRYGIDLGKISTHVYPRRIMVRGYLTRVNGAAEGLDGLAVGMLFRELERIKEIRHVQHDLRNWRRSGEGLEWVNVDEAAK